jgi:hypothetical protein
MTRPITINIPHALGKDEARRRITIGFDRLRQQMTGGLAGMIAFQERWEEDRLHFEGTALGQKITGRFDVKPDSVEMQLDLPEILAAMADRIRHKLQNEGRTLLKKGS